MRPSGEIDYQNYHVVDWLWSEGVPLAEPDKSASMEAHKAQFVEQDPWYCLLGNYKAWYATRAINVLPLSASLPIPF